MQLMKSGRLGLRKEIQLTFRYFEDSEVLKVFRIQKQHVLWPTQKAFLVEITLRLYFENRLAQGL